MITLPFVWLAFGFLTAFVALARGASFVGWFVVGIFFGPLGLIAAFFLAGKRCKTCKSLIHREAKRCPKCHADQIVGVISCPPPEGSPYHPDWMHK